MFSEDIEMTIQGGILDSDNRNQNGNTSQVTVIDENTVKETDGDGLEPPYEQVGKEQKNAAKSVSGRSTTTPQQSIELQKVNLKKGKTNSASNQLPDGKTEKEEPIPIPLLTEEEEEEEKAAQASKDPPYDKASPSLETSQDPPYERAGALGDRRSQSVKGRIESTPKSDPPPLPIRNKALQRSTTFNSPSDSKSPSVNIKADVHTSKDAKVDEPSENQPFLPQVTSDSNANTETRFAGLKRFLPGSRKRSNETETKQTDDITQSPEIKATNSNETPNTPTRNPSNTSDINIEDLYAKVDKSRKRKPNPPADTTNTDPPDDTNDIFQKVNFKKVKANSISDDAKDVKKNTTTTNGSGGNAPLLGNLCKFIHPTYFSTTLVEQFLKHLFHTCIKGEGLLPL